MVYLFFQKKYKNASNFILDVLKYKSYLFKYRKIFTYFKILYTYII